MRRTRNLLHVPLTVLHKAVVQTRGRSAGLGFNNRSIQVGEQIYSMGFPPLLLHTSLPSLQICCVIQEECERKGRIIQGQNKTESNINI
jgi:hypothetical protein